MEEQAKSNPNEAKPAPEEANPGNFDEDEALAEMLKAGILFSNTREYLWQGEKQGETVVLFVNCNDIFAWACADAEDVKESEVKDLYQMWKKDGWGIVKWACKKRNLQPQQAMVKMMKENDGWEDWMSKLQVNPC
jgi:hypothetical protein